MNQKIRDEIKYFARNILGCGCSEDVFHNIQMDVNYIIPEIKKKVKRINIGNRLLIYVYDDQDGDAKKDLDILLEHGLFDRNTNNFNRFRLTILKSKQTSSSAELQKAFSRMTGIDDKLHLHMLDETDALAFLRD